MLTLETDGRRSTSLRPRGALAISEQEQANILLSQFASSLFLHQSRQAPIKMAPKAEDGAPMGSGETVKKNFIGNDSLIPNAGKVHLGKSIICVASES